MNKENEKKLYDFYCIGCGICVSEFKQPCIRNAEGFLQIEFQDDFDFKSLNGICPISIKSTEQLNVNHIWGESKGIYYGHAIDKDLRTKASSGGVLSAICLFLLDEKKVDGIIHVSVSKNSPIETDIYISTTKEELYERCGSRYTISSPLKELSNIIDSTKTYAFIGKPCDVTALKNYINITGKYTHNIKYILSFFCAGLPSHDANLELLNKLGTDENMIKSLNYRGKGWPGKVTAIDIDGSEHQMLYEDAWGGVLGRQIHPFCKFCMDGIGERADISCGDGWYLNSNNEPDFQEKEGRNIVFSRNLLGNNLLQEISNRGYIKIDKIVNMKDLNYIQKYQLHRKATMKAKVLAYSLFLKKYPRINKKLLQKSSKNVGLKIKAKFFFGTVKRILKGKI